MTASHTRPPQRFQRSPSVVWRLATDRLLVRRADGTEPVAEDLLGAAALVWVAVDEPRTSDDVAREVGIDPETVRASLDVLLAHRWIELVP